MDSTVECKPITGKPVVYYHPDPLDLIMVGKSAFITPVNHYGSLVSNTTVVRTSTVIVHDPVTGEFETRNTVYVPTKQKGRV